MPLTSDRDSIPNFATIPIILTQHGDITMAKERNSSVAPLSAIRGNRLCFATRCPPFR